MNTKTLRMTSIVIAIIVLQCICVGFSGCSNQAYTPSDYSKTENWLHIPEITKEVDTIYLYPTTYHDYDEGALPICNIHEPIMRSGAEDVYLSQATVFEDATNVFAPFYRQSNAAVLNGLHDKELREFQQREQRADVFAALDYYFENYNENRPFILAGHSQGSLMTRIVLEEYMPEHPEQYERMIAAYVIGYSVTEEMLENHPHLKFAEGENDTGVIVSWNTEGPENKDVTSLVVEDGAISINPLNWKRDETYAPVEENRGCLIADEAGTLQIVKGFGDAQIDLERGVVVCTTAQDYYVKSADLFGPASLHSMDYGLFYQNIKDNVALRIETYQKNKSC